MRRFVSKNYGWGEWSLLLLATAMAIVLFGLALTAGFGPNVAWISFIGIVAVVMIVVAVRDHKLGQYLPRLFALILAIGGSVGALSIWPYLVFLVATPFNPKLRASPDAWAFDLWLACGYLVYFGWLWRAVFGFPRGKAVLLWFTSILVHLPALIYSGFQLPIELDFVYWFIFATVLSSIALRWEFARKELPDA